MAEADVSVIIVNYNSGSYTRNLVECLQHEPVTRRNGKPGRLEILVVENGSPDDQSRWLDPLRAQDVQVLTTPANLGYSGGCNFGARRATGRHLLFMNPDVMIVPGGVDALCRYLDQDPLAGQVGPRGWFDSHRWFHLPRIELPTLSTHLQEAWRLGSRRRAEAFALHRTRHALRIWSARQPQEEPVLAGYAFMMPRDLALALGPFDESFPLYYEDSDLTRRVRESGHRCLLVPGSEMVHLYNKSAGQFAAEAQRKMQLSQDLYFRKHYGAWAGRLVPRLASWLERRSDPRAQDFSGVQDLGRLASPPTFEIGARSSSCRRPRPYVLELTLDALFTLAVGHLDERPALTIPEGVWEHFDPTRFFVRALSLPELEPLGAYTFEKTTPCAAPPTYPQFLQCLEGAERHREMVA